MTRAVSVTLSCSVTMLQSLATLYSVSLSGSTRSVRWLPSLFAPSNVYLHAPFALIGKAILCKRKRPRQIFPTGPQIVTIKQVLGWCLCFFDVFFDFQCSNRKISVFRFGHECVQTTTVIDGTQSRSSNAEFERAAQYFGSKGDDIQIRQETPTSSIFSVADVVASHNAFAR